MKNLGWLVAGVLGGALAAYFLFATPDGISQREAREMARAAGDSAIAVYRSSGEMEDLIADRVSQGIKDTVAFYDAELRAAAVVEIRRDTIHTSDTVVVTGGPSLRVLRWDPVVRDGVTIEETNYFDPPIARGTQVGRTLDLSFDPDTLAVALLRLENGIERMTALLNASGEVVVIDAAVYDPGPTTFDKLTRYVGAAGCVLAGYELGRLATGSTLGSGDAVALAGGGSLCVLKVLTW